MTLAIELAVVVALFAAGKAFFRVEATTTEKTVMLYRPDVTFY